MHRRAHVLWTLVALFAGVLLNSSAHGLEAPSNGSRILYLNNNDWTAEDRDKFYHASEGPWYIPYEWFSNLETIDSKADHIKPLNAKDNFEGYGLIVDPTINPNGLPVGFVISKDTVPKIGLTCAGCHTGQIEYRGHRFIVDGGAPITDIKRFVGDMFKALGATINNANVQADGTIVPDEQKFLRFARRYFKKDDPTQAELDGLRAAIGAALKKAEELEPPKEKRKAIYPLAWGYGRLDAFGRGGNTLLTALSQANFWPASAPVSFPPLWGAYEYSWVQWNGSIMQPMGRNISQAITGSRRMDYKDEGNRYKSDVNVVVLNEMEHLTIKLRPPRWPKGRFENEEDNKAFAIDTTRAASGKTLFNNLCAGCHVPSYSNPNKYGKEFLDLNVLPLNVIGTDPTHANNFADRMVDTGILDRRQIPAVEFMRMASDEIRNQRYKELNVPREQYAEMDGFRENQWRGEVCRSTKDGKGKSCWRGYVARPLAGVWATPPFLHNGSVPNLYQLLSPVNERSKCFYLGHREFDPKHVGYTVKECQGPPPPEGSDERAYYDGNGFKFVTSLAGNFNTGHEFNNTDKGKFGRLLRPDERLSLIEYLKTCDLEVSRDKKSWENNKSTPPRLCTKEVARR